MSSRRDFLLGVISGLGLGALPTAARMRVCVEVPETLQPGVSVVAYPTRQQIIEVLKKLIAHVNGLPAHA